MKKERTSIMKIRALKKWTLTEDEWLTIARLLLKAGYVVKMRKTSTPGGAGMHTVEFWEEDEENAKEN